MKLLVYPRFLVLAHPGFTALVGVSSQRKYPARLDLSAIPESVNQLFARQEHVNQTPNKTIAQFAHQVSLVTKTAKHQKFVQNSNSVNLALSSDSKKIVQTVNTARRMSPETPQRTIV